jgi:methylmalonyl-CoA mutase C-terminal domain/subunit
MAKRPIRILIGKPGLDGHDRGAKVVVKALLDAGMEVIYTGRHQTVDMIANAAAQEDVEAIGLSVLSGAHLDYCTRLKSRLSELGMGDVALMVGGTIPAADVPRLQELGYAVFGTGSTLTEITDYVRAEVMKRRQEQVRR